ncbi:unnamed protein product [Polarella glacialis]|uniref:Glycoside hydrolase family 2 catalytic domain-containing protein n=1 Tax=Polarella glacialis TaxID=89957 RepID=A0A813FCX0_POLGL|nr:unnamed protein product [Polarella glacialis]
MSLMLIRALYVVLVMSLTSLPCLSLPAVVQGRRLIVNGVAIHLKGVNWNPVPIGKGANEVDFMGSVDVDMDLMQAAGVNVIRTYVCITDSEVLDKIWARGIQVLNGVYNSGHTPLEVIARKVEMVKDHPAILMWVVGNEWNYNSCYAQMSFKDCQNLMLRAATLVREHDRSHPVSTVYGEMPPPDVYYALRGVVDVWGINIYSGLSFSNIFTRWRNAYDAPMFLAEYGADAYNSLIQREDGGAQAHATAVLTQDIVDHSTLVGGVCLGGVIFSFNDEWWKDRTGSPWVHDVGGVAPGGGPYPDAVFNEEWWGLVTIGRQPRRAYWAYAAIPTPVVNASGTSVNASGITSKQLPSSGRTTFSITALAFGCILLS